MYVASGICHHPDHRCRAPWHYERAAPNIHPDASEPDQAAQALHRMKRWLVPVLALCVLAQPALSAGRDDELQSQQWGLSQVHAPAAWKVTEGRGVTVAVIDSGVDAKHPDFQGRVL